MHLLHSSTGPALKKNRWVISTQFLVVFPEFQTTHLGGYSNPSNFWVNMLNYFVVATVWSNYRMEGNFGSGKRWGIWRMIMNLPNLSHPNFLQLKKISHNKFFYLCYYLKYTIIGYYTLDEPLRLMSMEQNMTIYL